MPGSARYSGAVQPLRWEERSQGTLAPDLLPAWFLGHSGAAGEEGILRLPVAHTVLIYRVLRLLLTHFQEDPSVDPQTPSIPAGLGVAGSPGSPQSVGVA